MRETAEEIAARVLCHEALDALTACLPAGVGPACGKIAAIAITWPCAAQDGNCSDGCCSKEGIGRFGDPLGKHD